jgi:ATP-dependent Lon protease
MLVPLMVGNPTWIAGIDSVASTHKTVAFFFQKEPAAGPPEVAPPEAAPPPASLSLEGLGSVGCAGRVVRFLRLPDGNLQVLLQGLTRVRAVEITQADPFPLVTIEVLEEHVDASIETQGLAQNLQSQFTQLATLSPSMPDEIASVIASIDEPGRIADFVAANTDLPTGEKQALLDELDVGARLRQATVFVTRELEVAEIGSRIQTQIREQMDKSQRDYVLREQLKAIQRELGEQDETEAVVADLRKRLEEAGLPEDASREAERELNRFTQMNAMAPEAGMIRTYLEWMASLPWNKSTEDHLDLDVAKAVLDEDHHDLEKVKDRILDYLAVRKLKADMKGPILCFVGPPGVGKTSLGQSIARALGRKFARLSLGGVHDEAEIRGFRRTYIGAMPGRVIQGLRRAESNNPVFMLDEVDKLGADFRGDPSAALLEVLDPEQNNTFVDHYLDVPFDLSKVMFIATANMLDTMPPALRDRLEIIELAGYGIEEKLQIARSYLIPRQLQENGITESNLEISDEALRQLIEHYTREAGVRGLEREIATICRRVARKVASGTTEKVSVTPDNLSDYLGRARFHRDETEPKDEVGMVTGLAWTPVGGDVLFVEARAVPGRGNLMLTGHLGEVMQESARAGLTYLRSRAEALDLPEDFHEKTDIHVHVPAGAIPKDGPSAGVTIATAMISALTQRPVKHDVAMTGEITLRGRVMPVGAIPDKVMAAHRAGVKTVIIPKENEPDLEDVPEQMRSELTFVPAEHMDEVIKVALVWDREEEEVAEKLEQAAAASPVMSGHTPAAAQPSSRGPGPQAQSPA